MRKKTKVTKDDGTYRDVIESLRRRPPDSEIVIQCSPTEYNSTRSAIYKAANKMKVTVSVRRLSAGKLGIWLPNHHHLIRLTAEPAQAAYRVAARKGLPCTITPEEVRNEKI